MLSCLHKLLNTVFVMCAIYDHTRENCLHSSLPACLRHTCLQILHGYRYLTFQHLDRFYRKGCIHYLITCNKRDTENGISISFIIQGKFDPVFRDLMDLGIFSCKFICRTSKILRMLTHYLGSIRIISIVDHRNPRHHDPCLLSCNLGNRISKILHVVKAYGCDHAGCRIFHCCGRIQTAAKTSLQRYIIHACICKDHHSHKEKCLKICRMIISLCNQLICKFLYFQKCCKESIIVDDLLIDLKSLVDLHQMRRCKKPTGISCFTKY